MKKLLSVLSMLLMAVMTISLSSCSSDDDEAFDNAVILGTWTTTEDVIEGGEYVPDMEMQVEWTFKADNTASERMYIKMNNIITKDVTVYFTYVYKGSTITMQSTTNSSTPPFTYEISVTGNKMRFGNQENGYFDLTKMK